MTSIERLRELDRWLERRLAGASDGLVDDEELSDEQARRLLEHARQPLDALERPPASDPAFGSRLAKALAESGEVGPGHVIGPFEISEVIGSGGMGVVYRARRVDGGFEQTVALKVLGGARPDSAAMARFERERDLLSRLEHPGIARLIDGGMTEQGRPWFAMEYIEGRPIDAYCREYRLGLRARIELMGQVCEALDYAHGQMVLHRDIKPANILVDEGGRVRLVDFGLGGIQADLASGTPEITQLSRRWLTPEYASPEQLRGEAVDVRSEVYQLGLVLYRLLCANSPYDVSAESPADWIDAVTRGTPTAPSDRWNQNEQAANEFRRSPQALRRRLRGDLDQIVLMALRKEPERRYSSVRVLGDDLQRYLEGSPVEARPDGIQYKLGKYVSRHPWGLAAVSGTVMLAIAAAALHIDRLQEERDQAQLEAHKAQVVRDFLTDLFEVTNPVSHSPDDFTVDSLVQAGVARIDELDEAPLVQAAILSSLGAVNQNLGDYETAADLRAREVRVLEAANDAPGDRLADALHQLGLAQIELARLEDAQASLEYGLNIIKNDPGDPLVAARLHNAMGNVLRNRSRYDVAEEHSIRALELIERASPDSSMEATIRNNLGIAQLRMGDLRSARNQFSTALELRRDLLGPDHAWTTIPLGNLAYTSGMLGDFETAENLYRQVVDYRIEDLGELHPRTAIAIHQVGRLNWERRAYAPAREWMERASDIQRETLGSDHPYVAVGEMYLSQVLIHEGALERAEQMITGGLELLRSNYANDHQFVALGWWARGQLRLAQGRLEEAERDFQRAIDTRRAIHGGGHRDVARAMAGMARVHQLAGRTERARQVARSAMSLFENVYESPLEVPEVRELGVLMDEH